MREAADGNKTAYREWQNRLDQYAGKFPGLYAELEKFTNFSLPAGLKETLLNYREDKADATRSVAGRVLNICAREIPQIVGGCADLAGSTKAAITSSPGIAYIKADDFSPRNIAFGVREHAMAAVGNGLALGRKCIPFTSTFFTFLDYMKPGVRLAALMKLRHLFIFSHDSIYVGEDGPTHQPIEHLNSLRTIPGLYTFRPADDVETAFSFLYFLEEHDGPAAIVTTRQKVEPEIFASPFRGAVSYGDFKKGGYIFYETRQAAPPDIIIGASGSELGLACATAQKLEAEKNKKVRVISIPCLELFRASEPAYRDRLLNRKETPLVWIEASSHRGVELFYDRNLYLVDIQSFGASAPGKKLKQAFNFYPDSILEKIKEIV